MPSGVAPNAAFAYYVDMFVVIPMVWTLIGELWQSYKQSKTISKPYSDIPAIDVLDDKKQPRRGDKPSKLKRRRADRRILKNDTTKQKLDGVDNKQKPKSRRKKSDTSREDGQKSGNADAKQTSTSDHKDDDSDTSKRGEINSGSTLKTGD